MFNEALNHSKIELGFYLDRLSEQKNLPYFSPEILEDTPTLIKLLKIRNYCCDKFQEIAQKTEFEQLSKFLNESDLPHIRIRDI